MMPKVLVICGATASGKTALRIYSKTRTEVAEIVIEGSHELLLKLSEFAREAREIAALIEDDE